MPDHSFLLTVAMPSAGDDPNDLALAKALLEAPKPIDIVRPGGEVIGQLLDATPTEGDKIHLRLVSNEGMDPYVFLEQMGDVQFRINGELR
jgi:hypothetical protein